MAPTWGKIGQLGRSKVFADRLLESPWSRVITKRQQVCIVARFAYPHSDQQRVHPPTGMTVGAVAVPRTQES